MTNTGEGKERGLLDSQSLEERSLLSQNTETLCLKEGNWMLLITLSQHVVKYEFYTQR